MWVLRYPHYALTSFIVFHNKKISDIYYYNEESISILYIRQYRAHFEDIIMLNYIKNIITARIEAEMQNIMDVCIEAGKDIDASIEEALKF